jgi:ubiquinone biosynthesis protein COQ4
MMELLKTTQFAPRRALRAARTLAADPDDLPQVFTIIESLSGDTLHRVARRMGKSQRGRRLLAEKPDIVELLANRAALARLPEGSLGRAYLAFVERENISPAGIRAAGDEGMTHEVPLPEPIDYVHARLRDTHDLWHAAVGYHGDVLGETALLGFTFAQTWNPGIALIMVVGLLKTLGTADARTTILDGFRRGRRAAWLPEQDWESMLALPLDEVRRRLSLDAPAAYTPIRSDDLRATGKIGSRRPA